MKLGIHQKLPFLVVMYVHRESQISLTYGFSFDHKKVGSYSAGIWYMEQIVLIES